MKNEADEIRRWARNIVVKVGMMTILHRGPSKEAEDYVVDQLDRFGQWRLGQAGSIEDGRSKWPVFGGARKSRKKKS